MSRSSGSPPPSHADEVRVYRNSRNRLSTLLRSGWRTPEGVQFRDLAEAGFFMRQVDDRGAEDEVECIFCGVKISNWVVDMDPFVEHERRSPSCNFIRGDEVDNIPLLRSRSSDPIRGHLRHRRFTPSNVQGQDVTGSAASGSHVSRREASESSGYFKPSTKSGDPSPDELLGSVTHKPPKYSMFVTTELRLASYPSNWSKFCPVPAKKLAEAGYFYSGEPTGRSTPDKSDVTTCFSCGSKAHAWEPEDDPWQIHRQFKGDCYFLALNDETSRARATVYSGLKKTLNLNSKQGICHICKAKEIEIISLPCRHASCCSKCSEKVRNCPICERKIEKKIQFYLS